jgi:hypothetical protein
MMDQYGPKQIGLYCYCEPNDSCVHFGWLRLYILNSRGIGKGKSKAIPLQVWTIPVGSRRLRLPDFKAIGT